MTAVPRSVHPAIRRAFRLSLLLTALVFTLSLAAAQTSRAPAIGVSVPELVFAGVKDKTTIPAQSIVIQNTGDQTLIITGITLSGTNASSFDMLTLPTLPLNLAPNASHTINVRLLAGTTIGYREASVVISASNAAAVSVPVYGLRANGLEGGNEPTLANVVKTLGININVGWTGLANGIDPDPIGDEVLMPLMVKAGSGVVTIRAVGRYSPARQIPYGYYLPNGTSSPVLHVVNAISATVSESEQYPPNHQTLNPRTDTTVTTFDPGSAAFGIYVLGLENRLSYTEDALNAGGPALHAVRIYPVKNRAGVLVPNTYLIAFEDASNGDYQDYMFVISNVRDPNAPPPTDTPVPPTHTPTTVPPTDVVPTDTPDAPPTLSPGTYTPEVELSETPSLPQTGTPVAELPDEPVELLINTAFEIDWDQDNLPDGWKAKHINGDKLKCNKPEKNKFFANNGNCGFMFKAGAGPENSKLVQKPAVTAINTHSQGHLVMSVFSKTKSPVSVETIVKVVVHPVEPTRERSKQTLRLPASDSFVQSSMQLPVSGDVAKIKVVITNRTAKGKVFIDDASLMWHSAATAENVLPLP